MKNNPYEKTIQKHAAKPPIVKNMAAAFFFGGLVCVFGQGLAWFYTNVLNVAKDLATTYMIVTVIFLGALLTGLGVYDRFGQVAKAGGFIPISGFANSLTSAALEGKSEGIFLGIASNLFKLAGAVLVFAVMSGFFFGLLRYFLVESGLAPALDHETLDAFVTGVLR